MPLRADGTLAIQVPRAFKPLLEPHRYKGARGGRGSAKSNTFADLMLSRAVAQPGFRAACMREVQRTLDRSSKQLLEDKIAAHGLADHFRVMQSKESEIRAPGGGKIIFQGLQDHTADSVRGLEGFDVVWVDEAHAVSDRSLRLLRPTIRKAGSELWFSWNPDQPSDPVEMLFEDPLEDTVCVQANWRDNPWFPDELRAEMERDYRVDPDAAAHTWAGEYWQRSHAQVLHGKWRIDEFEADADWDGPYYGADWGYAQDPTTLVLAWIHDDRLWIEYQASGVGVGIGRETTRLFEQVPGARGHRIRGDSARPETIAHMRGEEGWDIVAAPKWSGSVHDGVEHLRSYDEIIIHPRCTLASKEARLYCYKTDRLTGEVLPAIEDKHNHTWDAVRYALAPRIRTRRWRPVA